MINIKKLFVYPYKAGSKSAKTLAGALGSKRIKKKNSKFRPKGKVVINWGSSSLPQNIIDNAIILNHPEAVRKASNKLAAFDIMLDSMDTLPEFTKLRDVALKWIEDGHKVFCRTKLTGNSGDGIVIAETLEGLVDAPLYTKWARIDKEYRIHVFRGEVIDKQRKARKKEVPDEDVNWKIRNLAGGFIFARGDCNPENGVEQAAVKAVKALGLDFGAVDVIYTKMGEVKVLEINTACGLEGSTIDNYVKAFSNLEF